MVLKCKRTDCLTETEVERLLADYTKEATKSINQTYMIKMFVGVIILSIGVIYTWLGLFGIIPIERTIFGLIPLIIALLMLRS